MKKLNLKELKLKSFVTNLESGAAGTVKGGDEVSDICGQISMGNFCGSAACNYSDLCPSQAVACKMPPPD